MHRAVWACWGAIVLVSCQTPGDKSRMSMARVHSQLVHLGNYRSLTCQVTARYAEPVKTQWMKSLSTRGEVAPEQAGRLFAELEELHFTWSATPRRCRLSAERAPALKMGKEIHGDLLTKLDQVFCIWLQSFYSESPLSGLLLDRGELEWRDNAAVWVKSGGTSSVVVRENPLELSAQLSIDNRLSATYESIGGKAYPRAISHQVGQRMSGLRDIRYQTVRERRVPISFWLDVPTEQGQIQSYLETEIYDCELR